MPRTNHRVERYSEIWALNFIVTRVIFIYDIRILVLNSYDGPKIIITTYIAVEKKMYKNSHN